ncbi:serpin B3-like isoform X2 [Neocloeon triangulifer]|uniref:serpin B3-like isoform X2 n=1 Tax=Neocloeon triangulifer TaxID=2078957 RepID=UPI00286EEEBE|nr:serpin B3-like isoform X2 [Neocloeon triangulifer]
MSSPVKTSPFSAFGINFYKKLQETEGNVVASPISALTVLAMALNGARGETEAELRQALQVSAVREEVERIFFEAINSLKKTENAVVTMANKAFIADRFNIKPNYVASLKKSFLTTIEGIDFSASDATTKINDWVAEATNQKIQKLFVDPLDSATRLVLVNALYFKGEWRKQFDRDETETKPFKSTSGNLNVQMMSLSSAFYYKKLDQYDAQLVEIPYKGNEFSMVIILPNKEDGLTELEGKLGQQNLTELLFDAEWSRVNISLPRFKIESSHDLKPLMQKMGVNLIFLNGSDFSGITDENVSVTSIVQKAYIDVNEEGSEAAAATGISMELTSAPGLSGFNFNCDHPFLYFVLFKRAFTIFGGRVSKPTITTDIV